MHIHLFKSNICTCDTHTHGSVVECSKLQLVFVYVYEPAVKEGWILGWRYMEVRSVCVRCISIWACVCTCWRGSERTKKRVKERGRTSHLYSLRICIHLPE